MSLEPSGILIGQKLQVAIEKFSTIPKKKVAEILGTTEQNLYRLFKRDSIESKYLEGICKITGLTINFFFNDYDFENIIDQNKNNPKRAFDGSGLIEYIKKSKAQNNDDLGASLDKCQGDLEKAMDQIKTLQKDLESKEKEIELKDKIIKLLETKK